jgi:hypothetical protein
MCDFGSYDETSGRGNIEADTWANQARSEAIRGSGGRSLRPRPGVLKHIKNLLKPIKNLLKPIKNQLKNLLKPIKNLLKPI